MFGPAGARRPDWSRQFARGDALGLLHVAQLQARDHRRAAL